MAFAEYTRTDTNYDVYVLRDDNDNAELFYIDYDVSYDDIDSVFTKEQELAADIEPRLQR